VVDACGTGFHFDKNDFLDLLSILPLKTKKSIGAPMNFASVGLKGKLGR